MFQFHTGSIKSIGFDASGDPEERFNSILVRLKVLIPNRKQVRRTGFNSILVRLKDFGSRVSITLAIMFQFHTGSIKSLLGNTGAEYDIPVSIPYWFD